MCIALDCMQEVYALAKEADPGLMRCAAWDGSTFVRTRAYVLDDQRIHAVLMNDQRMHTCWMMGVCMHAGYQRVHACWMISVCMHAG